MTPAKAARLKRKAEEERKEKRNSKLLLIAIIVATVAFFIGFCVFYSIWIERPHDSDHSEQQH